MTQEEPNNTPSLAGWVIAAAAGVFVFWVALIALKLAFMAAAFVSVLVCVVVGVILGMLQTPAQQASTRTAPLAHQGHAPAPVVPASQAVSAAYPVAAPVAVAAVSAAAPTPPVAPAVAASAVAPAPVALAAELPEDVGAGQKPQALAAARGGVADDLKKIEGIGPVLENLCHELGIFHFDQIAAWGPAEIAWMDGNLKGFRGRVTRDKWVAQATLIGTVGMDEFLRRAQTNDY